MPAAKRDRDGLYQRPGSDVWYVQRKNRRISLGTSDKEVARLKLRDLERTEADPTYAGARSSCLETVATEFLTWLESRPKPPTLAMYECHLGHFLRIVGAELPMVKIDARVLDSYFTTRRGEPWGKFKQRPISAETLVKERGTWAQLLQYAARTDRYHRPVESVLAPMASSYQPLERALTEEQVPCLLAELTPNRRAVVCFLVGLGADWCAVERARVEDFDQTSVLIRGTKNAKRWGRVPIVPPFGPWVEEARAWLCGHVTFAPWNRHNQTRDLALACARAGLPRVTARDLRRTFGRILRARGVSPALIGDMLRHSDGGRMAARVYGQLEAADLGRLVAALTGTESVQAPTNTHENDGE